MEFLLFTLINLVIGIVLYVLFSMRMQAAQEKMKAAHPLQKDVEENIRDGLQSMNAHLEEMHEVRANFYQLLRHAEEVAKRLEDASRKAARKRTGRTAPEPAVSPSPSEPGPPDAHVERLLERLGADEFRLSEPAASPPERSKPAIGPGPGVIDTLGTWAARMFGMKEARPRDYATDRAAEPEKKPAEPPPEPLPRRERISPPIQLPSAESRTESPPVPQDPNAWIRSLLASGTQPGEISRMTGRSLAEIELIASLPAPADVRRRTRLSE